MKKHAIIPIFIPHLGCPNDCVFCNQRKITARLTAPDAESVRATIEEWLSTLEPQRASAQGVGLEGARDEDAKRVREREEAERAGEGARDEEAKRVGEREEAKREGELETIEIAFYGGSFTGLSIEEQSLYLSVAKEYLDAGRVDGIHLSTRPDYIDKEILDNLKKYGVRTIEIGVQSFDDEVLAKSQRGHTSADVYKASEMIKAYGFDLGIQLMIGLPGDSLESCVFSAKETAKIGPKLARLYPTIVLDDTKLLEMYESGEYQALTREEAVMRTKEMYKILRDAGIYIMRVGLKSTDLIGGENGDGGAINGGTYHPAFRQLVESAIARDDVEPQLDKIPAGKVHVYSNPAWFSNLIGNCGENKKRWAVKYPALDIKFCVDRDLADGDFRVEIADAGDADEKIK